MRFSNVATLLSGLIAAPFVLGALGEPMSSASFLRATRCAAYESLPHLAGADSDFGAQRMRLNAEARRQTLATVISARAEIRTVRASAAAADPAKLEQARAQACAAPLQVT